MNLYFVSFIANGAFGNVTMSFNRSMTEPEHVKELTTELQKVIKADDLVILNFVKMKEGFSR